MGKNKTKLFALGTIIIFIVYLLIHIITQIVTAMTFSDGRMLLSLIGSIFKILFFNAFILIYVGIISFTKVKESTLKVLNIIMAIVLSINVIRGIYNIIKYLIKLITKTYNFKSFLSLTADNILLIGFFTIIAIIILLNLLKKKVSTKTLILVALVLLGIDTLSCLLSLITTHYYTFKLVLIMFLSTTAAIIYNLYLASFALCINETNK